MTLNLPVSNDISDKAGLRKAVDEAKKWMRQHHPTSIHESVVAHKKRITRIDPRFDVNVSLVNDHPHFGLRAKEVVDLQFVFSGKKEVLEKKLSDLFDKGALVLFHSIELIRSLIHLCK